MNRVVAQVFAGCLAVVHAVVLGALALALLGVLLNLPQAAPVSELARAWGGELPPPLVIGAAVVGYVLVMGTVSTLVAINQNLERLARAAEREAGLEIAS